MSGQGAAEVDFGAFPGANETSVAVIGQAEILDTSGAESICSPTYNTP